MMVKERSRSALASAVCNCLSVVSASVCWAFRTSTLASADFDAGLRGLHLRDGLVVVGLRLLELLAAVDLAGGEILLALQFEVGARRARLGGCELRVGLVDGCLLRHHLLAETGDGRLLHGDVVLGRLHGQAIVAVVDAQQHVAGLDVGVVVEGDLGHVARHLGGQGGVARAHVGVVGGHQVAAGGPPVAAVVGAEAEGQQRHGGDGELADAERLLGRRGRSGAHRCRRRHVSHRTTARWAHCPHRSRPAPPRRSGNSGCLAQPTSQTLHVRISLTERFGRRLT